AGVQPPEVVIDRDFNVDPLQGTDITAINTIYSSGLIDQQTALEILKRGEVLGDDVDLEQVLATAELAEQQKMEQEMELMAAKPAPVVAPEGDVPPAE
ncbi:MAG: hypothetical protein ACO23M_11615, partial [Vulcanococcus sp.]